MAKLQRKTLDNMISPVPDSSVRVMTWLEGMATSGQPPWPLPEVSKAPPLAGQLAAACAADTPQDQQQQQDPLLEGRSAAVVPLRVMTYQGTTSSRGQSPGTPAVSKEAAPLLSTTPRGPSLPPVTPLSTLIPPAAGQGVDGSSPDPTPTTCMPTARQLQAACDALTTRVNAAAAAAAADAGSQGVRVAPPAAVLAAQVALKRSIAEALGPAPAAPEPAVTADGTHPSMHALHQAHQPAQQQQQQQQQHSAAAGASLLSSELVTPSGNLVTTWDQLGAVLETLGAPSNTAAAAAAAATQGGVQPGSELLVADGASTTPAGVAPQDLPSSDAPQQHTQPIQQQALGGRGQVAAAAAGSQAVTAQEPEAPRRGNKLKARMQQLLNKWRCKAQAFKRPRRMSGSSTTVATAATSAPVTTSTTPCQALPPATTAAAAAGTSPVAAGSVGGHEAGLGCAVEVPSYAGASFAPAQAARLAYVYGSSSLYCSAGAFRSAAAVQLPGREEEEGEDAQQFSCNSSCTDADDAAAMVFTAPAAHQHKQQQQQQQQQMLVAKEEQMVACNPGPPAAASSRLSLAEPMMRYMTRRLSTAGAQTLATAAAANGSTPDREAQPAQAAYVVSMVSPHMQQQPQQVDTGPCHPGDAQVPSCLPGLREPHAGCDAAAGTAAHPEAADMVKREFDHWCGVVDQLVDRLQQQALQVQEALEGVAARTSRVAGLLGAVPSPTGYGSSSAALTLGGVRSRLVEEHDRLMAAGHALSQRAAAVGSALARLQGSTISLRQHKRALDVGDKVAVLQLVLGDVAEQLGLRGDPLLTGLPPLGEAGRTLVELAAVAGSEAAAAGAGAEEAGRADQLQLAGRLLCSSAARAAVGAGQGCSAEPLHTTTTARPAPAATEVCHQHQEQEEEDEEDLSDALLETLSDIYSGYRVPCASLAKSESSSIWSKHTDLRHSGQPVGVDQVNHDLEYFEEEMLPRAALGSAAGGLCKGPGRQQGQQLLPAAACAGAGAAGMVSCSSTGRLGAKLRAKATLVQLQLIAEEDEALLGSSSALPAALECEVGGDVGATSSSWDSSQVPPHCPCGTTTGDDTSTERDQSGWQLQCGCCPSAPLECPGASGTCCGASVVSHGGSSVLSAPVAQLLGRNNWGSLTVGQLLRQLTVAIQDQLDAE